MLLSCVSLNPTPASTIPDILRKEEVILVDFKHFAMGHIVESVADEGIHHSDFNKFFNHSMKV